jgi:protocatechuate 3,4-dioxygenase beta subunit
VASAKPLVRGLALAALAVLLGVFLARLGEGPRADALQPGDSTLLSEAPPTPSGEPTPEGPASASAPVDAARASLGGPAEERTGGPPPPAAAAPPPAVRGIVVTEAGVAVAGAEVRAHHDPWSTLDRWAEGAPLGRGVASTRSDEGGRFTLEWATPCLVTVVAEHAGCVPARLAGVAPGSDAIRLVVVPAAVLRGRVLDEAAGLPIAGARVRVHHGADQDLLATADTDANGGFVCGALSAGKAGVIVDAPRHAASRWREVELVAGRETEIEVALGRGWTLGGRVVDAATGAPVPGARVSSWAFIGHTVECDALGSFRLEGVFPRPGTLVADAPTHGRAEVPFAEESDDLELRLPAALTVVGRIVGQEGEPIAAADVVVAGRREDGPSRLPEWRSTVTDADGAFRVAGLSRDVPLAVQARALGSGARTVAVGTPDAVGVADVGDIVLPLQAVLAGRFVDHDGRPLASAYIGLSALDGPARRAALELAERRSTTDSRGAFHFSGLDAGDYMLRGVGETGRVALLELHLDEGEQRLDLDLVLPAGGHVRGRLFDSETRRGLAGFQVLLAPDRNEVLGAGDLSTVARLHVSTGDDGSFDFAGVPLEGPWALVIAGGRSSDGARYEPLVRRGLVTDDASVDLPLRRLVTTIRGRVVNLRGEPVSLAFVALDLDVATGVGAGTPPTEGVLADDAGCFEIAAPAPDSPLRAWRTDRLAAGGAVREVELHIGRRFVVGSDGELRVQVAPGER